MRRPILALLLAVLIILARGDCTITRAHAGACVVHAEAVADFPGALDGKLPFVCTVWSKADMSYPYPVVLAKFSGCDYAAVRAAGVKAAEQFRQGSR